jgi:thiol-disulfide isomerase/thioredoxin
MQKCLLVAAISIVSIFALDGQTVPTTKNVETLIPAASRVAARDFTLTDVQGKAITLSKYKGKVVLLDFWATTCGGCKIELPWYVEFDHRYRDKGLLVIGLDMYGETPEVIKPFIAKWKMNYPVAIGTDEIGDRFGLKEMPLTLLIDRNGKIAISHTGIVDKAAFEEDIQRLLRQ